MRYRQWLHSCKCGISSRPVNFSKLNIKSKTEEQPLLSAVIYDHLGCHRVPLLISLSLISLPIICKSLWTVGKKESGKNKRRVLSSVAKRRSVLQTLACVWRWGYTGVNCPLPSALDVLTSSMSPGLIGNLSVPTSSPWWLADHLLQLCGNVFLKCLSTFYSFVHELSFFVQSHRVSCSTTDGALRGQLGLGGGV